MIFIPFGSITAQTLPEQKKILFADYTKKKIVNIISFFQLPLFILLKAKDSTKSYIQSFHILNEPPECTIIIFWER